MAEKKEAALNAMSISEMVDLCEGLDCWHTRPYPTHGLDSVMMSDGPHGLRRQPEGADNLGINISLPATCFPSSGTTACSWDTELISQVAAGIGREARANGVSLVLGPGLNIKRNPLCGRNFEYFSEDPFLSGKLAAEYVKGMQSETSVGSCLKHFAANSQEYCRFSSDSIMDERTLREIYLAGFEIAVKEGKPRAVMSSYNKLNGVHTGECSRLVTDILRSEWGFDGLVVSDWGATFDRTEAIKAGCDLIMPGGSHYGRKRVLSDLKSGKLTSGEVRACAERVASFVSKSKELSFVPCDMQSNHELARKASEESAVLMKNEGALPLKGSACLIGHMAKELRYQGVGSSHINPTKLSNPTDCCDYPIAEGCRPNGETDDELLKAAVELARTVDTPIVFAGLTDEYECEGLDRGHMRMPDGHCRMIEAVAGVNPNTVVVLLCGSVVEMPWIDRVNAVLYMGLSGQAGGEAILNLLTGKANPSGKLAETWPRCYDDVATSEFYGGKDALYAEGVFVGYRYYDASGVKPLFPFGHGLSYTQFEYSDIAMEGDCVSVTVKNVGDRAGAEVVQLYIEAPKGDIPRPCRSLAGFAKRYLKAGESARVRLPITKRSFAIWHEGAWVVPEGEYILHIAGLSLPYTPDCGVAVRDDSLSGTWYANPVGKPVPQDFERLLGYKYEVHEKVPGEFDLDSSVYEMMPCSGVMRLLHKVIAIVLSRANHCKRDMSDPTFRMMMSSASGSAIRNLCICGGVPESVIELLVRLANKSK